VHPSFGRYELLKRLAGGGMGEVFLARQRGLHGFEKLVVIKTLLPHLCEDEELIAMFRDEARVTAQLIHPNICQVFEFDQVGGVYYMAMEYLRGEDLRRLWRACEQKQRKLPVPLACRIVADAAAGLDFAHALRDASGRSFGIVHRDVSPQNIFVTFEGGVKLIDFGVAKATGRAQHTRTGALKGKYGYMSPEQAAGAGVDGRSDIFALGVVLHELLTGRRLFKAESDLETLARVRACQVPGPSAINRELPARLDSLVLRALAKAPEDRFSTAQEMRLSLEEWLIEERKGASSAHLAEFLKTIYAERAAAEVTAEAGAPGPIAGAEPSQAGTAAGAPPFRARKRMRATAAAIGLASAGAALVLLLPRAKEPLAPVPRAANVVVAPPPRTRMVTIQAEPEGAEIYEGTRLIGRAPKIWADALDGEHELTLRREGYHEERGRIVVARDGDEFHFRLKKLEAAARKTRREPSIKAER
jgi:eukaryotic-like serine/threonine-protein kinase